MQMFRGEVFWCTSDAEIGDAIADSNIVMYRLRENIWSSKSEIKRSVWGSNERVEYGIDKNIETIGRLKDRTATISACVAECMDQWEELRRNLHFEGSAEQTADGQYVFIATITLVKDGDKSILVDTGLGTNINARTELINGNQVFLILQILRYPDKHFSFSALEKHGLSPASVDIVVSTHGHPDHVGGVHDFPDALHYHSWYSHQGTKFNLTALFEVTRFLSSTSRFIFQSDSLNLSENVMLVKCRGHTSDDIAVVVRDVRGRGDVLVSGYYSDYSQRKITVL